MKYSSLEWPTRPWWRLVLLQNFPMPSEEERLKDRKRRQKQNALQDDVEDAPRSHSMSLQHPALQDQVILKTKCTEADVLIRDTLEAAR
ncbi:unnamed protein product [Oncorhynchus mykiss]|uniref:Uncharacterized protein n=1 Tax=Oncorhynchus mykiss TaxID=8022 RepID=A0A060Y7I1_ONCMY|nr:unnamed protein product [Oncorhynchus mykiss]